MTTPTELLNQSCPIATAAEATRAALIHERDVLLAALIRAQAEFVEKEAPDLSHGEWMIGLPQVSVPQRRLIEEIMGAMVRAPERNLMRMLEDIKVHVDHPDVFHQYADESLIKYFCGYERYAKAV